MKSESTCAMRASASSTFRGLRAVFVFSAWMDMLLFFFFQAEDGIRDFHVTGVQTCALPICEDRGREPRRDNADRTATVRLAGPPEDCPSDPRVLGDGGLSPRIPGARRSSGPPGRREIGRASCRERV